MDPARDRGPRARAALARRRRAPGPLARLGRRAGRRLRPPRTLHPTRAGWVFFALTLGVGLAALNTGNNLLYLVQSLLLAFLVLSGVMSESALRGIRVRRRLPAELFAERPAPVAIEIHNAQRRVPSFAIVVEDVLAGGAGAGRVFALRVDAGATEARSYLLTPAARGALRFEGVRVTTRFPFGLFAKAMRLEQPAEALVYPAFDPVAAQAPAGAERMRGETHGGHGGGAPESAGVRAYAPGDANRRVHWRSSLRRRELLVREQEREMSAEVTVRLRTRAVAPGEAFERDVRRATSEVIAQLAAGRRVGLRTDAEALPPAAGVPARRRLLALLARVAPETAP